MVSEPAEEQQEYQLDRMKLTDVSQISVIEKASFSDPWPEYVFSQALRSPLCRALVVRYAGAVAGYLISYVRGSDLHIANVAVSPEHRRQGVAKALLVAALNDRKSGCTHTFLDVRESNAGAIQLYRNLGFVEVGRRPRYYRYPVEDALVMRRPMASADTPLV